MTYRELLQYPSELQIYSVVLIDLPMYEIAKRYKVSREEPLPIGKAARDRWTRLENVVDLATYERQHPKSLFYKGIRTKMPIMLGMS
jgi:hypothetical protein